MRKNISILEWFIDQFGLLINNKPDVLFALQAKEFPLLI